MADQVVSALGAATQRLTENPETSRVSRTRSAAGDENIPRPHAATGQRIARSIRRRPESDERAASIGAEGGAVGQDIESRLGRVRRGGAPLAGGLRRSMEGAFGADFGSVRVHEGSEPAALNRALGAKAFTIGSDIFFGANTPDTSTRQGQHLIAHELTHTLQQGGSSPVARTIRRAEVDTPTVEAVPADGESAAHAPGEASDGVEADGETVAEGTTAEVELPVEQIVSTGPPPGVVADATDGAATRSRSRSARPSSPAARIDGGAATSTTYRIALSDFSSRSTLTRQSTVPDGGEPDAVVAKVSAKSKLSAGAAVNPFGALNSGYTTSKVKWRAKTSKKAGNSISLGFALKLTSKWGTSNGGRTDVSSGSSSAITADNYPTAVSDLTPGLQGGSWVAPRSQFWSEKICARHEKYHFKDVSKWFAKTGKKLVADDLNGKSITVAPTDDNAAIDTAVQQLVQTSIATITNAHIVYMNGTGQTYYNYPSEIRAFGDGRKPYESLAKSVEKRGQALAKKQAKKNASASA